ncbi:MAG: tRNA 2-thiouridine(34) synthase MnmA [Chloroflexota bacterium]
MAKVVVAMSGGVDSAVAAALLVQQGHQVTGVMLHLWSEAGREDENKCCTPESAGEARREAEKMGFPFYVVEASEPFRRAVVQYFLDEYARGATPNPCIVCNPTIKWGLLLDKLKNFNADYIATGHYARLRPLLDGKIALLRALDELKDQSYMLHRLTQAQLAQTFFPLGELHKPQVREIARSLDLSVAAREESQDLCFVADRDYRDFLVKYIPTAVHPGDIVNEAGKVLGKHQGLAFYTIGQRKGIRIAAPQPYYVLDKDIPNNVLIVGTQDRLGCTELDAVSVNWIGGSPPESPCRALVKIRYKADFVEGMVTPLGIDSAHVRFEQPMRDISPGQAVVFYDGESVLGGGFIKI